MGSFTTSCFVSRQIISDDEPCRIIPIMQTCTWEPIELTMGDKTSTAYGPFSSNIYANRFWDPVGSFIEATYADYGRFKLKNTRSNRLSVARFLFSAIRQMPKVAAGKNTSHDLAFDLPRFLQEKTPELYSVLVPTSEGAKPSDYIDDLTLAWDYLFEVAQEQRTFWSDICGRLRPLTFAVMHEATYQLLVDKINSSKTYGGKSREMRSHFDQSLEQMRSYLAEQEHKPDRSEFDIRVASHTAWDRFSDALRRIGPANGHALPHEMDLLLAAQKKYLAGEHTDDELFERLKSSLEARYVYAALDELNLHFEPMIYSGQDYQNASGQQYLKLAAEVSKQVCRASDIRHYGDFHEYSLMLPDNQDIEALFAALRKAGREFDTRINLLKQTAQGQWPGFVLVTFECTATLDYVQKLLEAFESKTQGQFVLPRNTLQALKS